MDDSKIKVRMFGDETGKDGMELKKDKVYDLPADSANHWLKRNKAKRVGTDKADENDGAGKGTEGGNADPVAALEGMTVAELKDGLTAAGVSFPADAKKADLVELAKKQLKA